MKNTGAGLRAAGLFVCTVLSLQAVNAQDAKARTPQTSGSTAASQLTPNDVVRLRLEGRKLSAAEAAVLEEKLAADPWALTARFTLNGYYSTRYDSFRQQRLQQALWCVQNIPGSELLHNAGTVVLMPREEGYEQLKQLWLKQLEVYHGNLIVLSNAVDFFLLPDRPLAERLLKQGAIADPANAKWPRQLGHLYLLQLGSVDSGKSHRLAAEPARELVQNGRTLVGVSQADLRDASIRSVAPPPDQVPRNYQRVIVPPARQLEQSRLNLARMASAQFELAYKLMRDDAEKSSILVELAKSAFEAGEVERARGWAVAMLTEQPKDWNYGNVVHHGHLILGRIALLSGDLAEAKQQLIAAGETPGSPQLNSFGPNMTLAKELLERGEREAVTKYFELCANFWKNDKLANWTATVKGGGIPDFGANLAY